MLAASIPPKFPIAFGAAAGSANIRPIPVASQQSVQPGAASLTDGFPPPNFVAIAAGGIPPFGQDANGILNQITLWEQWQQAGAPVKFDAAFAAAIGGYPSGAQVPSNTGHAVYESLQDNNSADPNTGSALWRIISCVWSTSAVQAAGSANIQTITLTPAPTSLTQMVGIPITILSQGTNTGPVTINPNGLGARPLLRPGGNQLAAGMLTTGTPFIVIPTTSAFILTGGLNTLTTLSDFQVIYSSQNNGYLKLPNGVTRQVITATVACGNGLFQSTVNLNFPFLTTFLDAMVCFGGTTPPGPAFTGSIAVIPLGLGQVIVTTNYTTVGSLGVVVQAYGI